MQSALYFELVEPVAVPRDFKNSEEIILNVDDGSMLQSFQIKSDQKQKDKIDVIHKANRFVNYLSFKTGLYISHKHPRKVIDGEITEKIGFSMGAVITDLRVLDLTHPNMIDHLSKTSTYSLAVAHFASGQRALNGNNFAEAIREFYLTIEDSGIDEEKKYKILRDSVSHKKIDNSKSPDILRNEFNIKLPKGDSLDITSPEIDGKLEKATRQLREVSWNYVDSTRSVSKSITFKHKIL